MRALLFSGGMDSYIGAHYVKPDIAYYFKLNHRYQDNELKQITKLRDSLPCKLSIKPFVNMYFFEEKDANIPLRNLYLLMGAVNYLLVDFPDEEEYNIYLIVQEDEMSIPDRSSTFFESVENLLSFLSGKKIILHLPFYKMDKTDMVTWYLTHNLPVRELLSTHSCYTPIRDKECGSCPACFRKWVALVNNDVNVNSLFSQDVKKSDIAKEYFNKLDKYSEKRQRRILKALGK